MDPLPSPFRKEPRLEKDLQSDFNAWQTDRTPASNARMLRRIQPMIDDAVRAHVGTADPILRSRARQLALSALQSYDPARSSIKTHLFQQLQPLKRETRQRLEPVRIPERDYYARLQLQRQTQELTDRIGREPTTMELADSLGLSPAKIVQLRRGGSRPSSFATDQETGEPYDIAVTTPGADRSANLVADLIYDDLPPIDQKILEWSLGLHGQPRLPVQEMAARLNRTPGAISQRRALIQRQLDEVQGAHLFGG